MRRLLFILTAVLILAEGAFAQSGSEDIIQRPTAAPESAITLRNTTLPAVSGDGIISGKGNNSVTLWDRSIYERQPKSVVKENAKEMFPSGLEVPKPDLDRPITDAWQDLKPGYACEGILNAPYYFQQLKLGEEFTLDITYRNVGTETWDFNIDVMQYAGDKLEKDGKYLYDIGKDFKNDPDMNNRRVRPGETIRIRIPMRAPTEKYHEDNKYYSAYTLVKNWNKAHTETKDGEDRYGWSALHSSQWQGNSTTGMFCPVYFYIYVP